MSSKNNTTNSLLLALEKSIDGYIRLEDFTFNSHVYAKGYDRPLKKNSLAQAIRRLRLRGIIETEIIEGDLIIKLLQSSKSLLIDEAIRSDKSWDGKWRVVAFDIPETHRKARDILRRKLKNWQFEQWQKSVWVSKRNVTKPLRDFINDLRVEKWVRIFEADNV